MFLRSVITDNEKGAPRHIAPNLTGRGNLAANPVLLNRINSQGSVQGVGGTSTFNSETENDQYQQQQQQLYAQTQTQAQCVGLDEMDVTNKIGQNQTHAEEGMKYAKMPPTLKPEKPKKVEKSKISKNPTPQQLALFQQQQQVLQQQAQQAQQQHYQSLQQHGLAVCILSN